MTNSTALAARVDAELEAELTRLAATSGRAESWLINEALRSNVATEQQFRAALEACKQAFREGHTVDHQSVVSAFHRIIAPGM